MVVEFEKKSYLNIRWWQVFILKICNGRKLVSVGKHSIKIVRNNITKTNCSLKVTFNLNYDTWQSYKNENNLPVNIKYDHPPANFKSYAQG